MCFIGQGASRGCQMFSVRSIYRRLLGCLQIEQLLVFQAKARTLKQQPRKAAMRTALVLLCFLAVPLCSEAKPKDPTVEKREKAEKLFADASLAYKLQKYEEALEGFQGAYVLTSEPSLLFNIAQCYRQLFRLAEAKTAFQSFIRDDPQNPLRANAEERLKELDAEIFRLSQKGKAQISTQQEPTQVFFDGEPKGDSPLSLTELTPGEHKITVKKEGFIDFEVVANIKPGEVYELKVPQLLSEKSLQQGQPPKTYFLGAAALGGSGVLSLGISGLLLHAAVAQQNDHSVVANPLQKQVDIGKQRDNSILFARVAVGLVIGAAVSASFGIAKKKTEAKEVKP
jgi:tetratricopeptide (TPR) repeat protein